MRALKLTFEIHELLDLLNKSGHEIEVYREPLAKWQQSILHYRRSWQVDSLLFADMIILQTLSVFLNVVVPSTNASQELIKSNEGRLLASLDDLESLFQSDSSLDAVFTAHAIWLIHHLRVGVTTEDPILFAQFMESVHFLKVYVAAAAENSTTSKDKFRAWAQDFFSHPFTNTVITLGGTAGLHAIGAA